MIKTILKVILIIFLLLVFITFLNAAGGEVPGDADVVKLSNNIYRITFPYGLRTNIGVSAGKDGILLVDTGFKETVPDLKKILKKLGGKEIKYIINTHSHGDHCRGNVIAGPNTKIIGLNDAESMVKKGVFTKGKKAIKGKKGKVFKKYYYMKFNDEEIRLFPSPGAHSNFDWIIHFTGSGVVHMGDLLLSQSFPAVSKNIKKYFPMLERVIDVFPDNTTFISGHGKDLKRAGVKNYLKMLYHTADIVKKGKKAGKTIKDMQNQRILKDYESYNTYLDWLTTNFWIEVVYKYL